MENLENKSPTSASGTYWTYLTYSFSSDDQYAVYSNASHQNELILTGFNFNIIADHITYPGDNARFRVYKKTTSSTVYPFTSWTNIYSDYLNSGIISISLNASDINGAKSLAFYISNIDYDYNVDPFLLSNGYWSYFDGRGWKQNGIKGKNAPSIGRWHDLKVQFGPYYDSLEHKSTAYAIELFAYDSSIAHVVIDRNKVDKFIWGSQGYSNTYDFFDYMRISKITYELE